jgi:hypothetical protein
MVCAHRKSGPGKPLRAIAEKAPGLVDELARIASKA